MDLIANKYMTFKDAQTYMSLKKDALYNLIENGYILSFVDKNRRRLVSKESIDNYFSKCESL